MLLLSNDYVDMAHFRLCRNDILYRMWRFAIHLMSVAALMCEHQISPGMCVQEEKNHDRQIYMFPYDFVLCTWITGLGCGYPRIFMQSPSSHGLTLIYGIYGRGISISSLVLPGTQ